MKRARAASALLRAWQIASAVGLTTALILTLWGVWLEPASLRTRSYSLALPKWPAACAGLRVAILADLHVGSPFNGLAKLERVVAETNELQPDLILLAGDYVIHGVLGGNYVAPSLTAQHLAALRAPMGAVAVLGNHDRWHDATGVRTGFGAAGIVVLEDTAVRRTKGDCDLWIAGVSDFWQGKHDIAAALRPVPDDANVIVVTHNPDIFPDIPERVALTVAGHTHGGQVYLPLIGRLKVPSLYGERFAIGHIVEYDRHLFVSPGIGTSIIPVRFLVPPEISLLTLTTATH